MNREERRKLGIDKETAKKMDELNKPCTIMEAVQLAQGVADDAITNYHNSINPIVVSLSIQVEVLKELLFKETPVEPGIVKSGILNENEFLKLFNERVEDYNKQKEEAMKGMQDYVKNKSGVVKGDVVPSDVDIKVVK